jgi:hypothetical protein
MLLDGVRQPRSCFFQGDSSIRRDHLAVGPVKRIERVRGALMRTPGLGGRVALHDLNLTLRYAGTVVLVDGAAAQTAWAAHETLLLARVRAVWGVPCPAALSLRTTAPRNRCWAEPAQ